ncbi:MAG TPA: SRPBCC domain-containing protein, partial [Anditalea sp.]|nr:SRPBCC domain-containing protein [Anditalea sp.]
MTNSENNTLKVSTEINASVEKVWKIWNDPQDIVNWNPASDHWETSDENNEIKEGEKFFSRKQSENESAKLDLEGTY